MEIARLSCGTTSNGLTIGRSKGGYIEEPSQQFPFYQRTKSSMSLRRCNVRSLASGCTGHYSLSVDHLKGHFRLPIVHRRRGLLSNVNNELNLKCSLHSYETDEPLVVDEEHNVIIPSAEVDEVNGTRDSGTNNNHDVSLISPTRPPKSKDIKHELLVLSLPAIAGQAIDPVTQLMETAYIGRLGAIELASAGVSITVFNNISKLFNMPLLSVATSFVAEDISRNGNKFSTSEEGESGQEERQQLASVSTALFLAIGIGIFEALALSMGSGLLLDLMGISSVSPMRGPAKQFLLLRALGAPAFVVSLALQGIFRGFKDTKTPVFCLGFGNFTAIVLFPLLMYYFGLGVAGAAISTVLSQYIVAFSMMWCLNKKAVLLPPKLGDLQFGTYLKSGGFLIGRTLSVLLTMTLAASMAARQGTIAMAAHQICFQLWLAVSLLIDAPAASAQALIASYISKGDYKSAREVTQFVLKIGLTIGISLAVILALSFSSLASIFTKDEAVLGVVRTGLLFVSATQPINALAFIFDGLHYGVSDFPYAACSMMMIGVISSAFLLYAAKVFGLPGVWSGLTLFMGLRMAAGFFRILSKNGPWWFMHDDALKAEITMSQSGISPHILGRDSR
ncbi:hypothetical protein Leryth_017261 [Lithospermum erythrorhizon]|nr:hypothetical protein Leryth_017261 [Lithospermum erythrorhizon]